MNRRRISLVTLVVAALAAATVGGVAEAESASTSASVVRQDADQLLNQGAPGVLVRVDTPGHTTRVRSGFADVANRTPVPWDAEFRIGSFTKTFVAVTLLQLVGEGKLSLDDTVGHWLPGVVTGNGNDGDVITVRELLNHTSGVPEYSPKLNLFDERTFEQDRFKTVTLAQAVALAMTSPPTFAPGTDWAYSNTNYMLAGMIIEKVSGHSWEDEVRQRVVEPLGLRHTFVPATYPFIPGPHAIGYQQFSATGPVVDATDLNPSFAGASGAMISDAEDGNRFLEALIKGELLKPAQLAEMETTVPTHGAGSLPGLRDGLGIFWLPNSCGGEWTHPGGIQGYETFNGVSPDGARSATLSMNGFIAPPPTAPAPVPNLTTKTIDDALCG